MIRRGASGDHPIVLHNHFFGPPLRGSGVGKWGGGWRWNDNCAKSWTRTLCTDGTDSVAIETFRNHFNPYHAESLSFEWANLVAVVVVRWLDFYPEVRKSYTVLVLFSTLAVAFDSNKESGTRTHGQLKVSKFLLYSTTEDRFSNFVRHRLHSIVDRHRCGTDRLHFAPTHHFAL